MFTVQYKKTYFGDVRFETALYLSTSIYHKLLWAENCA